MILITLVVAIYFAVSTDSFLTWENFKTLLPYFAPFAIFAAGETFLMINGEIDLSIGAVYLFAPFLFHETSTWGLPLLPGLVVALVACMVVGLINGVFTAVVGINSFITTLGMLLGLEGLTLIISSAEPVSTPGTSSTEGLSDFARVFGGGTYSELIWALVIVGVLHLVLTFTRWGIYSVAVGGNRRGAEEAGIRVRLVIIRNFVLCATLAGFVGVLEAVRTTSVQPDPAGANSVLFDGIAAAVIGGTLLVGGSGTVIGGPDRRPAARHPQRRARHQGRQRRLPELLPRAGDHRRDGGQHVHRPRQDGGPRCLRKSSASSTSASPSDRSSRSATSTCTSTRARCSACSATTAPASRR